MACDPLVVALDLVAGLLRAERPGELVRAQFHRLVERVVEPQVEEPALGGSDRAGMRRGALEQAFGASARRPGSVMTLAMLCGGNWSSR